MNKIQKLNYLYWKLNDCHRIASYAYELLSETSNLDNLLALQILNNAEMERLDAENYYYANEEELKDDEFTKFFDAFALYKLHFIEFISIKSDALVDILSLKDELSILETARDNTRAVYERFRFAEGAKGESASL